MSRVIAVNPFRCRVWDQHGRMEEYVTEVSCRDEIHSMREVGQLIPVIGRRIHGDPLHDVEVVCGMRRLFAARHLNIEVQVELRELSDRDSIVVLDVENRQRRDWSPYERGRSFARWMASGHFESQEDLAKALRISPSQVSRLLKMAKLPAVVVEAFPDPTDICETWAMDLYSACECAPTRSRVIARARSIKSHARKVSPRDVFHHLRVAGREKMARQNHRQEVIVGESGHALFRVKHLDRSVTLSIDRQNVSHVVLTQIKHALRDILQRAISQVEDIQQEFVLTVPETPRLDALGLPPVAEVEAHP